jgi:hypothetical protein
MVPGGALQAADLGVAARQKPRPGTEGRARTVMMCWTQRISSSA